MKNEFENFSNNITEENIAKTEKIFSQNHEFKEICFSLSTERRFYNLDFRNVNLSGIYLSSLSIINSQFDGADLTGANFQQVKLINTSFNNSNLTHARFELVDASSASFSKAMAKRSRWEQINMNGTDFSGADLDSSVIRVSDMEKANFRGVDFSHGMIVHCNASDADFSGACFAWTNTVGSNFSGAKLATAKKFFLCREIVVEALEREIHERFEIAKIVGAARNLSVWCYPEWKDFLNKNQEVREVAYEIFQKYSQSGCLEALQDGWKLD